MVDTLLEQYWVETLNELKTRADAEIKAFVGLCEPDDIYVSGVVEPQRCKRDLEQYRADILNNRALHLRKCGLTDEPTIQRIASNSIAYYMYMNDQKHKETVNSWADMANSTTTSTDEGGTPRYQEVSAPAFEIQDIPQKELHTRLKRGEIMPRAEWLPSNDIKNRKCVSVEEAETRIDFSTRLVNEAGEEMRKRRVARAGILYTQAVNSLKYYFCEDTKVDVEVQDLLKKCRRNKAVCHLKLREFRECIAACDEGLLFDPHDGKLQYLRARALFDLGELRQASEGFKALATDGWALEEERMAGKVGLKHCVSEERRSSAKTANLVKNYEVDTVPATMSPAETTPQYRRMDEQKLADIELPCRPELYIELLQDITRAYTTPSAMKEFERVRATCDYDEKKIIVKLRSVIPPLLNPVFAKYEALVGTGSFEEQQRTLNRIHSVFTRSVHTASEDRSVMRFLWGNLQNLTIGDYHD